MVDIREIYAYLMTRTGLFVDALWQKRDPVRDGISRREAYRVYGKAFVSEADSKGILTVYNVGKKLVYSRRELNCFLEAKKLLIQFPSVDSVVELYDALMHETGRFADDVISRLEPQKDEMSLRQACREFGVTFVKTLEDHDLVSVGRKGTRKFFSRKELNEVRKSLSNR